MKRILIGDSRENLLTTLETLLRFWGYRVLVSSRPAQLTAFLEESPPDLLLLGSEFLANGNSGLRQSVEKRIADRNCTFVVLAETQTDLPSDLPPHERLDVPLDVFALFALVQKHLEKFPRKNLRLDIQLPGMLCREDICQLTEVLSLSAQGLFVKTGFRLEKGEQIKVFFPLMGMHKELEIDGQVLYRVHPDPENNYLQGLGIEFLDMGEEDRAALEAFLENRFLGEVSDSPQGAGGVAPDQLRSRIPSLRLI